MNHAPTPWLADVDGVLMVENDDPEQPPCEIGIVHFPEDAAHIVRCVHSHDELVAALHACSEVFCDLPPILPTDSRLFRANALVRAAPAKVQV